MLTEISLSGITTFTKEKPAKLEPERVNFIFGHNGSGKSTLGRYLATSEAEKKEKFPDCTVKWENNIPLKTYLYTSDYVSKNFKEGNLRGIEGTFFLGEENIEIKEELNKKREEQNKLRNDYKTKKEHLDKNQGIQDDKKNNFENILNTKKNDLGDWIKTPLKGIYQKQRFTEHFFKEFPKIKNRTLPEQEELKIRTERVFSSQTQPIDEIKLPNKISTELSKKFTLLETPIVGAENNTLSEWIKKLDAEEWFRKGAALLQKSEPLCPFCQKEGTQDLSKNLQEYFNKEYEKKLSELHSLLTDYEGAMDSWRNDNLPSAIEEKTSFFNNSKEAVNAYELCYSQMEKNKQEILNKIKNPELSEFSMQDTSNKEDEFLNILKEANAKIKKHNDDIQNRTKIQPEIRLDIFKYISHLVENEYQTYQKEKEILETEYRKLKDELDICTDAGKKLSKDITELEKQTKNVRSVAEEINGHLKGCGFSGFHLVVANEESDIPLYRIIRNREESNEENVFNTLSEGEKSFISFLYFYNEIEKENEKKPCVVIFDDPVTSMDAETLFATSALIRDMAGLTLQNVGNGQSTPKFEHIKQVFLLTHNIYFYQRVARKCGNKKGSPDYGFFIFSKNNNISEVTSYDATPIKSTYEMWWDTIRKAKENPDTYPAIANTCRSICEDYFKLMGWEKPMDGYVAKFNGKDKITASYMIEELQMGSHAMHDDLHSIQSNRHILEIFERIFTEIKHEDYYKMMMRKEETT